MEALILVGVLVLVVVFIMGMTPNNPIGQQAMNGLHNVTGHAQAWYQDYMNWYEASIQPSVRRLGHVFMGVLATSVAMAWLLPGDGLTVTWFAVIAASALIAGYLVNREMRRPPVDFTVLTFGPMLIAAAAFHGMVVFVAGHAADSQYITFMGALELFFALQVFRMVGGAAVKLAAFGFYGTEGIVNMITRVVVAVATLGSKGLASVFGSGGVVIVKEEEWYPAYERGMQRLFAAIAPVLAFGIVLHDPKVTTFVGMVGFVVGMLVYPALAATDIDIKGRTQRTARIFEVLMYLFLTVVGLSLFSPGAAASLVQLKNDLAAAIGGIFTGTHMGFDWISGAGKVSYIPALFAALIFGAGAAFAWGESRIRKFSGGVLAFFAAIAFVAFAYPATFAVAKTVKDDFGLAGTPATDEPVVEAPPAPFEEPMVPSVPAPVPEKTVAVNADDCNGPSCGNAALDEYCRRNPGVCGDD